MLVTEALNELKVLDARINRAIDTASFIVASKKSEKNACPGLTKEDFSKKAKESQQSIDDLISRREKIKTAIVESNAKTFVEICGEKMSVAKAIDTKDSITYKARLLDEMKQQYDYYLAEVNKRNTVMEEKINELVKTAYGKDTDKNKGTDYDSIANPYRTANEYDLVDPLELKNKIEELERYIEEFTSTVDSKLQISNCITSIDID